MSCWGLLNAYGERGDWDAPEGEFTQVSVTFGMACGVRTDTTVACWGDLVGTGGSWGTGSFGAVPAWLVDAGMVGRLPPDGDGYGSVLLGGPRVCGLRVDGSVWCADDSDAAPAAAAGRYESLHDADGRLCGVRAGGEYGCVDPAVDQRLAAWMPHRDFAVVRGSCGLRPGGRLECWGYHDPQQAPPGVAPLISAAEVTSGRMCGVRAEGELICWDETIPRVGERFDVGDWLASPWDLFDGAPGGEDRPLLSRGPFVRVFSGGIFRDIGLCALSAAGEVLCSRTNDFDADNANPAEDAPERRFVDVAIGARHACAIRADGTVACWGEDHDVFVLSQALDDADDGALGRTARRWAPAAVFLVIAAVVVTPAVSRARRRRVRRALASKMHSAESHERESRQ